MAEKLTFVCSKFCRKIENVQISKKHHNYRTAGGVSRQRLSPRIIPLCHYRGFFLRRFCLTRPLLRPGPHLTAACLAAVQIAVIYLQNIFIIYARTMLQTTKFGVCIEYFTFIGNFTLNKKYLELSLKYYKGHREC